MFLFVEKMRYHRTIQSRQRLNIAFPVYHEKTVCEGASFHNVNTHESSNSDKEKNRIHQ